MLFKISLEGETHVTNFKPDQDFEDLDKFVKAAFKRLPQKYYLVYIDEDGDQIHLLSNQDLQNLISQSLPKVYVKIKPSLEEGGKKFEEQNPFPSLERDEKDQSDPKLSSKEQQKEEKVHEGITCDMCSLQNIEGIRYKCSVCDDFDLCQKCEAKYSHPHALIKILTPTQPFATATHPLSAFYEEIRETFKTRTESIKNFSNKVKEAAYHRLYPQEKKIKEEFKEEKKEEAGSLYNLPERKSKMRGQKNQGDVLVESASYLSDTLGIDFNRCYSFAMKNRGLNQQQLLVKYFEDERSI